MKSDRQHLDEGLTYEGGGTPVEAVDQNKGDEGYMYHTPLELTESYEKPPKDKLSKR